MSAEQETWSVFLRDPRLVADPRLAAVLARSRGLTLVDVRRDLGECWGVIEENASEERARALVADLAAQEIAAILFPDREVLRFPAAVPVRGARRTEKALALRLAEGDEDLASGSWVSVAWTDLVYCAWARVAETEEVDEFRLSPFGRDASVWDAREVAEYSAGVMPTREKRARQIRRDYLDFLAILPPRHFRIDPFHFAYASLLGKLAPTAYQNFIALVQLIRAYAGNLVADRSIAQLLDGDPHTTLSLPSLRAYDLYLLWNIQMAFKGPRDA
ncbi:MAG: hypothetical protein V2A58_12630 [Planctomycetota bacterium]